MKRALVIWLIASAIGVALIVLLPESLFGNHVLFRLSERHGPGMADSVGIAVILVGWLAYVQALWSRRRSMQLLWATLVLAALAIGAALSCIVAIAADQDMAAIGFAMTAVAAQLALGFTARESDGADLR